MRSIVLALAFPTFYTAFQTAPVMVITDNPELNQMYTVDQSEREGANVDWTALYRHDIERRSHLQGSWKR
ncbi:MAG: hypothetical protein NVS1B11_21080 [Terriglobales bacterium]